MVDPETKKAYPPFTDEDMQWFRAQLAEIVGEDNVVNVGRCYRGFDLELVFTIKPGCHDAFTDEVYNRLTEAIKERSGCLAPVIYDYDSEREMHFTRMLYEGL